MDAIELQTLSDEIRQDTAVAIAAFQMARARLAEPSTMAQESCAFHLTRFYNVIEQCALRITKAFENSFDDEKGWHTGLIRRLSIPIQGVRPPFFTDDLRQPLYELKDFRHVFVHAYELDLDSEKLVLLIKYAGKVAERLPALIETFLQEVARQQGLAEGG